MDYRDIYGFFDYDKLFDAALKRALSSSHHPRFVEIGCYLGKSTAYMGKIIKDCGTRVHFWAVDNWAGAPMDNVDQWYKDMEKEGKTGYERFLDNMTSCGVLDYISPMKMNSVDAAKQFENKSLDFVFIDGDHTYESVKADIAAWAPKVKSKGWLAGHDFNREEVARAVWEAFAIGVIAVGPQRPEGGNLTCWLFEIP